MCDDPREKNRGLGQDPEHHCIYGLVPRDRGATGEAGGLAQRHRRSHLLSWIRTQVSTYRWHGRCCSAYSPSLPPPTLSLSLSAPPTLSLSLSPSLSLFRCSSYCFQVKKWTLPTLGGKGCGTAHVIERKAKCGTHRKGALWGSRE